METISVFEHQPISLVGDDVPLRDTHLRQLERLNRQAGAELIRLGYKQMRATSYVGVIQLGNVTLQVLPKVDFTLRDDGNNPTSVDSAVANLLWMLVYAGELPVHDGEVAALLKRRADLFEILVRIFCARLAEQMERGLNRTYQRQETTLWVGGMDRSQSGVGWPGKAEALKTSGPRLAIDQAGLRTGGH